MSTFRGLTLQSGMEVLLYSDGESLFSLIPGNEISEEDYRKLMSLVEKGKERLKEINERKDIG